VLDRVMKRGRANVPRLVSTVNADKISAALRLRGWQATCATVTPAPY
jgi:hypothetical protein